MLFLYFLNTIIVFINILKCIFIFTVNHFSLSFSNSVQF